MFYASKNYKVVCKEDCYHVKNILDKNKLEYSTLQEALDDGCRECKHCFKDKYE